MERKETGMNLNEYQEKAHKTAIYPNMHALVVQGLYRQGIISKVEYQPGSAFEDTTELEKAIRNPYYPALGLAGEVGEYCNKLKKVMRDKGGNIDDEFKEYAAGELGDVLWYLAECASSLDLSLDEVAEANIKKLASRQDRGKLKGEGDTR